MVEGSDYRKLVLIDGHPLDPKTQKRVDAALRKPAPNVAEPSRWPSHRSVSLGSLELLSRLFDNKVIDREIINGRAAWKMESDPKPGIKAARKEDEEVLASSHTSWFDEQDGSRVGNESSSIAPRTDSSQPASSSCNSPE